jgi:hypothetical protein
MGFERELRHAEREFNFAHGFLRNAARGQIREMRSSASAEKRRASHS